MTLTNLYDIAAIDDIKVYSYDLDTEESMSLFQDGNCYIAIDPLMLQSEAEEKVKLAHEIGHCITGAFYNEHSPLDIRSKHENRANKWAIKNLVPKDKFKDACAFCNNRYELAEHFGVTEDFMQIVLDYYLSQVNLQIEGE